MISPLLSHPAWLLPSSPLIVCQFHQSHSFLCRHAQTEWGVWIHVKSSPLVWSTDVRSTRLYGQLLAGPNYRTLALISHPDIRSAPLYGQFSLDKTLTLQAGWTVFANGIIFTNGTASQCCWHGINKLDKQNSPKRGIL